MTILLCDQIDPEEVIEAAHMMAPTISDLYQDPDPDHHANHRCGNHDHGDQRIEAL